MAACRASAVARDTYHRVASPWAAFPCTDSVEAKPWRTHLPAADYKASADPVTQGKIGHKVHSTTLLKD